MHKYISMDFSSQYIKMPALIRKIKWKNMNKFYLIFHSHAEFTSLKNTKYSCTILPLISWFWNCCVNVMIVAKYTAVMFILQILTFNLRSDTIQWWNFYTAMEFLACKPALFSNDLNSQAREMLPIQRFLYFSLW